MNLVPDTKVHDIYQIVADKVKERLKEDLAKGEVDEIISKDGEDYLKKGVSSMAKEWLDYGISRSVTKRCTMTLPYGAKKYGFADQILEDINGMQKFVDKITMSIEKPDTLALPSYIYMDLSTRRIPDTETTVLSFIKDHAPYLKNFESMAELQDSATDINPTGKNVAFMYTKDPEKFSLEIPLPFYQYPLQVQKLETEIPCETRTAGLIIYYPLSMLLAYGI